MQTQNEPYTIYDRGWVVRIQRPSSLDSKRVLLLLHGWTGDENVMWIFTRNLPADYWILAPRGPVSATEGGYGWCEVLPGQFQPLDAFEAVTPGLFNALDRWLENLHVPNPEIINLMGFSQGAALCYTLLITHTARIAKTAALAGFLPDGAQDRLSPGRLVGKEVFVAHGTRDDTVPVALARRSVETIEAAGAQVVYCEDETSHKLGAACHRGLVQFFR